MEDFATQQRQPLRHAFGMGGVVLLHLLLFWIIQSGLSREVTQKSQQVVAVLLLSPDKPSPPAPPPPKPVPPPPAPKSATTVPAPVIPAPAVAVAPVATAAPAAATVTATTVAPAAPATPVARGEGVRTAAVVNAANCEKPEYPSASRRMEEEGTVHLRFLIGPDGKVMQSEIEKSSGYRRLDEAARTGLSKCQFRPATVDGKPEQAWASMRYVWRLE